MSNLNRVPTGRRQPPPALVSRLRCSQEKAVCIWQTLRFVLKTVIPGREAAELVRQEVEHHKMTLERSRALYKILEETTQPGGSAIIKIVQQYNAAPVGDYLN